jgi:hypothetical protein
MTMEMRPVGELQTEDGKRMADHLSDLGVKDSSMAFIVGDDGAELVTVSAWIYKRLTSEAGIDGVFAVGE